MEIFLKKYYYLFWVFFLISEKVKISVEKYCIKIARWSWLIKQAVKHFWTLALLRGVFTSCWRELCCLCLSVFSFHRKLLTVASCLSYRHDYQSSQKVSEQICSICQKSNKLKGKKKNKKGKREKKQVLIKSSRSHSASWYLQYANVILISSNKQIVSLYLYNLKMVFQLTLGGLCLYIYNYSSHNYH